MVRGFFLSKIYLSENISLHTYKYEHEHITNRINEILDTYSEPFFNDVELTGVLTNNDVESLLSGDMKNLLKDAQHVYDTYQPGVFKNSGAGGYQLVHKYYLFERVTAGHDNMNISVFFSRLRNFLSRSQEHDYTYNIVKYTYDWS